MSYNCDTPSPCFDSKRKATRRSAWRSQPIQFALVSAALVSATAATFAYALAAPDQDRPQPGPAITSTTPADRNDAKPPPKFRLIEKRGTIIPFREAVQQRTKVALEGTWGEDLLVLRADDGEVLPLWPTEAARFFYHDRRMWRRPVQLSARVYEGVPGLDLVRVYTIREGKLFDIYYWCDVCAIKMLKLQNCECCQGPIEIRETEVK